MILTLIFGLPNAGKSTYSEQFESVLHYDDISRFSKARRDEIYRATEAEVIEGIFNTAESRKNILRFVKRDRYRAIWIDTPVEMCLEREHQYRCRPDSLVLSHARNFEPPTYDEGWDEIIIIRPADSEPENSGE